MKDGYEIKNKGLKQLKTINTIAFAILIPFFSLGFTGGIANKNYNNIILGAISLILVILFYLLIKAIIEISQRIINIEEKVNNLENKNKNINNYYHEKY